MGLLFFVHKEEEATYHRRPPQNIHNRQCYVLHCLLVRNFLCLQSDWFATMGTDDGCLPVIV